MHLVSLCRARSDVQTDLLGRFYAAHGEPHVAAGLLTSRLRR
jgi:hypothetical protein